PGRDLRLDLAPPPRALSRRAQHGGGAAHAQHPPLRGGPALHRGHAEDRVIFLDASLAEAMPSFEGVEHEVLMPDCPGEREGALDYEELIASGDPGFEFPELEDEDAAAAMCYTSGTTGRPKGVVYSHRSTVLHSLAGLTADALGVRSTDRVMPIVPMFHANAWGLPYGAALAGASQVFPGPKMTPADIAQLSERERATLAAGVPATWRG